MRTNQAGIDLIKSFEGLRLTAYKDIGGVLTVGYGHTGKDVYKGQIISKEKAEALLKQDLERFELAVKELLDNAPTTQNQFAAMVSLAYNVGPGNFEKSSVLRNHKRGNYVSAAASFMLWVNAGKLKNVSGLIRRRNAERKLYVS